MARSPVKHAIEIEFNRDLATFAQANQVRRIVELAFFHVVNDGSADLTVGDVWLQRPMLTFVLKFRSNSATKQNDAVQAFDYAFRQLERNKDVRRWSKGTPKQRVVLGSQLTVGAR